MEHGRGRRDGTARVLEFHLLSADQFHFDTVVSRTGKGWNSQPVSWRIPERFRARVLIDEREEWITVPTDLRNALEEGELRITYKWNREGKLNIYRMGR